MSKQYDDEIQDYDPELAKKLTSLCAEIGCCQITKNFETGKVTRTRED